MAELTTQERLQPSLLDRLTDDAPEQREEGREQRVISATRLRECVERDLTWLLSTTHLDADLDLDVAPQVRNSVCNFGIPDLNGMIISGVDAGTLQRRIRAAILQFEPRLTADTLKVVVEATGKRMDQRALVFRIESEMWAQPIPLNLFLKTEVDLQTGKLSVTGG